METITYNFKIDNLISPKSVKGKTISFASPHYPSTSKGEDFIEGELEINNQDISEEIIKNCLELSCVLLNQNYFQITLNRISFFNICSDLHTSPTLVEPEQLEKFFNKLLLLSQTNHWFNHAQNWFLRSNKLMDPIDKFIYSWITFECLYGCLWENKPKGNLNGIKCLIANNYPESMIRRKIVETHKDKFIYLSNLSLKDARNDDKNWSEELKSSLESDDIDKIIINGVMAIAMIRHSIFHGNLVDRNLEAGKCFFPLNHLNSEIIKKIMV